MVTRQAHGPQDPGETVRLGRTPLTVSRLGLGTAWLGNMYQRVGEAEVASIIDRSFALGMRLVDTAPLYGLGLAESRIGPHLAARARGSFVLSTKVGRSLRPRGPRDPGLSADGRPLFVDAPGLYPDFDFSYEATLRSVEGSLARLGLDHVDVLLIHDPDDHWAQALGGAYPALERLRSEGAVQAIGAGMNQAEMLARFARETDMDVFLVAGRYTLLDQSALDDLLPECQARGIAVVIGGVFNSGVLASQAPGALYDYRYARAPVLARARRLAAVCARHGVSLRAAAIQFPLAHPAVRSVLTGVRSRAELDSNAEAFATPVPSGLWRELAASGLIPAGAPVPPSA
jgi:D-threo-aldose 1-dehydrogenase